MKRDVPGYIERAMMRVRDDRTILETLCDLFPDTMRWIAYYIDVCLKRQETREHEALNAKDRAKGKASS